MIFSILVAILALLFAGYLAFWIKKQSSGTKEMEEISATVHAGAMTFLNREYKVLVPFVVLVAIVLSYAVNIQTGASFIVGAIFSALAGNIGMRIATTSNARTAEATKEGIGKGLRIAFSSGTVMSMSVVGLGLLGISVLFMIFGDPEVIYGFGFGASSIALFARVGGGIFTKAADVGADLVGKVEVGIPEDDPRNPAVIADNVGDNVGDVAGMGADLFESYVNSIIAAMVLGLVIGGQNTGFLTFPLVVASVGILASIAGTFLVKTKDETKLHSALNRGIFGATIIAAVLIYFATQVFLSEGQTAVFISAVVGLIAGIVIGLSTEYYTSESRKPVISIAKSSQSGAATNIISGLAVGMLSTVVPVLAVSATMLISYSLFGLYGVAIAAVGMLSTLGITLATDTYGPVADNAAGIAEMAKMGKDVRKNTEKLDSVGNTTAAIGKGFAIGSAALTALALFSAFVSATQLEVINLTEPFVIVGLFIGGMLPFLFSSFTMQSVGNAAFEIVAEVRRQFKEIPGIMEGKTKPDYNKCIELSTHAALREMIMPGVIALSTPIIVGLLLGPEALGGLLAGLIVTGFLLAVTMANAGGAWDNAKKYVEGGHLGGKGTETHAASVVGDTVGDPFKDTSGPSLNILIKLVSIVSLIFAPLFV